MNRRKRRVLSPKFKSKVAIAAIQARCPVSEIARIYEVQPAQVSQWKKSLIDGADTVFERKNKINTNEKELKTLLAKIGELTLENEQLTEQLHLLN